jgi:hypothetical protein
MILLLSVRNLLLITIMMVLIRCSPERKDQFSVIYPQPLPGDVPISFLPGIVSTDSLDFNASFSPDGNRFYFSRSNRGKWLIFMTELRGGSWSEPVLAPFNEAEYSQADPFVTGDGRLFYISNRPRDVADTIPDYDIWFIRPQSDGSWTKPENPRQ